MIAATPHTHCRACGTPLPAPFLNLGMQPLANNLCSDTEHCDETFPMRVTRCVLCWLLQLDTVIDPVAMFSHYLYTPSQSRKTLAHFEELAETATKHANGEPLLAVDIGSNDGALLRMLKRRGWNVCGVDPAENLAKQANDAGLTTKVGFFNQEIVTQILAEHGQAGLITANNVIAHSPDWEGFAMNAARLLSPTGLLAIEFPYGPTMLKDGTFDLIYFEHASFPAIRPIVYLFQRHGLHVVDVESLPHVHGGSVRVWIGRGLIHSNVDRYLRDECVTLSSEACELFTKRVENTKDQLHSTVQIERLTLGRRVVGFTAPAKCVTLLTASGLGSDEIEFIMDDNTLKQGRMLPKLHIPIRAPEPLTTNDTVIVFAWNVAEDIMSKLPPGVDVLVPMPEVKIVRR